MRRIEIEPFDVTLFRDARPFGVAEAAGTSNGLFPPPPSAVYGALRTAALRAHGAELRVGRAPDVPPEVEKVWGNADRYGSLSMSGPVLHHEHHGTLWPTPCTVMRRKNVALPANAPMPTARPVQLDGVQSSSATTALPWVDEPGFFETAGGFLTAAGISAFLSGRPLTAKDAIAENDLAMFEGRTGIAIESGRRTVRTGALFAMGFRRLLQGVRIAVWLDGEGDRPLPQSGLLRLGQDGKLGCFSAREDSSTDWPTVPAHGARRILLYLATPARFAHGWLPAWIEPETLVVSHSRFKGRLISAGLDRPQMLGGWDLARNRPRALHRVVRAGSVYFLELDDADAAAAAVRLLHGKCISEPAEDESPPQASPQAGYGLCLTGVWQ
ncbi:MAG: type III-B CRISPR module-associated Cmr3 family protein [Candidatus Binatia bacterium]